MCGIFRYSNFKPNLNNFNGQHTVIILVNNTKKKIRKIHIDQTRLHSDIFLLRINKRYIFLEDEIDRIVNKLRINDPTFKLNLILIVVGDDSTDFILFLSFVDIFRKYNGRDNKKLYFISYIVDAQPQLRFDQSVNEKLNLLKKLNLIYSANISYARCLLYSENTVAVSNQLNCALIKFYNTRILFFDELLDRKLVEITFEFNSHHAITR